MLIALLEVLYSKYEPRREKETTGYVKENSGSGRGYRKK